MQTFSLSTDPEDMSEDQLRDTLTEFMSGHEDNQEEFERKQKANEQLAFSLDERKEDLGDLEKLFMEDAVSHTNLDEDTLSDRFSSVEIVEFGLEAEDVEADEDDDGEDDEEGEDSENTFDEKRSKTPGEFSEDGPSEQAQESLDRILG